MPGVCCAREGGRRERAFFYVGGREQFFTLERCECLISLACQPYVPYVPYGRMSCMSRMSRMSRMTRMSRMSHMSRMSRIYGHPPHVPLQGPEVLQKACLLLPATSQGLMPATACFCSVPACYCLPPQSEEYNVVARRADVQLEHMGARRLGGSSGGGCERRLDGSSRDGC